MMHEKSLVPEGAPRLRLLQAIADTTSDFVYIFNREGQFLFANRRLLEVWGMELDAIVGKTCRQLGYEQWHHDMHMREIAQVIATRQPIKGEVPFTAPLTGVFGVYEYIFTPVLGPDGEVELISGTTRDVTERKRALDALQASEERFRSVVENMSDGLMLFDADTNLFYQNDASLRIHGFDPRHDGRVEREHLAVTWLAWDTEERPIDFDAWPVARVFRGERVQNQILRVVRSDTGHEFFGSYNGSPIYDREGRLVLGCLTIRDITEQVRASREQTRALGALRHSQQELGLARDELARMNTELERTVDERTGRLRDTVAELEHFSYTITHDMRAPLRAMQGFSEFLQSEYTDALDSTGRDYLRRIIDAAGRMDQLITDSLNYAKAVQTELKLEPIDLGALLRGIVDSYPQFSPPRSVIELAPDLPRLLANSAGLTQCVSNLLGNAVKFVPKERVPHVRVWAEERGSAARIWIEDNGIGIAPEYQERIFEMFQRLSRDYEGTGVGLALVRKVVGKMRGSVGFESRLGEGSRFWIELQKA